MKSRRTGWLFLDRDFGGETLPTVRSRAQLFTLEGEEQADPADLELAAAICQAIPAPGEAKLLELTAPLIKDKERFRRILKQLVLLFRDACVLRAGGASCLSHQPEAAGELAHTLTRDQLMRLLEYAQSAQKAQDQNANAALLVTTFCARMRAASHGGMLKVARSNSEKKAIGFAVVGR